MEASSGASRCAVNPDHVGNYSRAAGHPSQLSRVDHGEQAQQVLGNADELHEQDRVKFMKKTCL
jgi:hypothetical protein